MDTRQYSRSATLLKNVSSTTLQQTSPFVFNQEALQGLSEFDKTLFESFSQGIKTTLLFECIHHAIEYQAKIQPEAIAAYHQGSSISYQALDQKANSLALQLKQLGVVEGDHVALFVKRSITMLVGILATLKIGAAYVPLDVGVAPVSQMDYILKTTNVKVVLTLSEFQQKIPLKSKQTCISLDQFLSDSEQQQSNNLSILSMKSNSTHKSTCFVLFTSGTTGKPNGVKVTHGNLCNILLTAPGNLGMRSGLKVSQILNISFDMSAWEILGCLSNGATLIIRGSSIAEAVKQADIVIATPSILASIDSEQARPVKTVAVAGEPCPRVLADKWSTFCAFYNSCGPTETTIINTAQRHYPESKILSIGAPTPNNTVYILDEKMKPCGIGEVGEMWAGGDCVSQGYIGNEALTAVRYISDPFLGGGRKMFRTRDLGRWTTDGQLEHLGRTDDQVKVRGFRVELDSVSNLIETLDDCTRAVTLKQSSRDLIAFVSPENVDIDVVKQKVASNLPYYCVPKHIIALPTLPLTERGKVNKKELIDNIDILIAQSQSMEEITC